MPHIHDLPNEILRTILSYFNLNDPRRSAYDKLLAPLSDAMRVCKRWLVIVGSIVLGLSWGYNRILEHFRTFGLGYYEARASKYWNDVQRPAIRIISREQVEIRQLKIRIDELIEENRLLKYVKAKNKEEW